MTISFQLNSVAGAWTNVTTSVSLSSFKKSIKLNANNDPELTITGDIEVGAAAYTFVKTNLIDSANRYSNIVYVKIVETECSNNTTYFKIENQNLRWCDDGACKMSLDLTEYNPNLDCIKQTTIADNWNHEFQQFPGSGNPHPRFRYCDVIKPTFLYGAMITVANALYLINFTINLLITLTLAPIIAIINGITGGSLTIPTLPALTGLQDILGCSRLHPAPFLRTYIDNVCTKCGVAVDSVSDVPFHDPVSIYYNTCLLTAYTTKGIKDSSSMDYIPANQPSWSLFDLLSKVKEVFNSRWFIKDPFGSPTLYFGRKDVIGAAIWGAGPQIDLSGADSEKLEGSVCYSFNGEGKPGRIYCKYSPDPSDNIGNELLRRFNGEYLNATSPNYTTTIERQFPDFGAMSFIADGKDTQWDSLVINSLATLPFGPGGGPAYKGCLKTQGDTFSLAKLIIWDDGTDIADARPISDAYFPTYYPSTPAFADDDPYDLTGLLMGPSDCYNYNYPISFDTDSYVINSLNLWGFHQIDAPSAAKKTNIRFEFKLEYCCAYNSINLFQEVLFQDGVTTGEIDTVVFDKGTGLVTVQGNLK